MIEPPKTVCEQKEEKEKHEDAKPEIGKPEQRKDLLKGKLFCQDTGEWQEEKKREHPNCTELFNRAGEA